MSHPERITRIVSQNGNVYEEGLSDGWNPIRAYWEVPSQTDREALRALLSPETTLWQYTHGVSDATAVSPDGYALDNFYLARSSADEVQWTCSATTSAMSRCTPPSRTTSERTSHPSSRSGAETIRSSCRPVPRRSRGTCPVWSSASSTPAISPWKRMSRRSRLRSVTSSPPKSATGGPLVSAN